MSSPSNTEWGHYAERVVRLRYGLEEIPDSDPRGWKADAVVTETSTLPLPAGTLIETKACRKLIVNGSGLKHGHIWFAKNAMEANAEGGGHTAIAVYDPDLPRPILRVEIIATSRLIEEFVEEWTANASSGSTHHKGEFSTRIEWSEMLSALRDPRPEWSSA